MLTAPVFTLSKRSHGATPPEPAGRPTQPGERMPVPGRPQAEFHRPAPSPGRVPVAGTQGADVSGEELDLVQHIEDEIEASADYQAIRPFLKEAGTDEEKGHGTHHRKAETDPPKDTPEPRSNPSPAAPLPVEPPVAAEPVQAPPDGPEPVRKSDPLALDLNGNGLETTGLDGGVRFDIDGDGRLDQVSFVTGGDAFLALDRNGNGRIDDGTELFGDQRGHDNGYAALAEYDDNGDGRIDAADRVFQSLRLFSIGPDGGQRLSTLEQAGVRSVTLSYTQSDRALDAYDRIAQLGTFEREDGTVGQSGDLLLGFRNAG